jgi:hypothetical protein
MFAETPIELGANVKAAVTWNRLLCCDKVLVLAALVYHAWLYVEGMSPWQG